MPGQWPGIARERRGRGGGGEGRLVIVISLIIMLAAADTVRVTHSAPISSLFEQNSLVIVF